MRTCWLFHDLGERRPGYEVKMITYPGILSPKNMQGKPFHVRDLRQRRMCLRCGKAQDVLVR